MFQLSEEGRKFVEKELKRYETKRSAIIPALYCAQRENGGWVSPDVVQHLSDVMEIPIAQINEVLTFYTMFNKKPVGKYHIQVCNNVACCLAGSRELTQQMLKKLNVELDQTTEDGRFTVSSVECLGSCGTVPMAQINDEYHENLNEEKVNALLDELR